MIAVRLADLHAACGVRWTAGPQGAGEILIDGVTTDSRGDVDGKLFVGIPGPRFDGARFAAAAVEGGARAVLVEEGAGVEEVLSSLAETEGVAVATCADAVAALGAMAALVRGRSKARVVGITGSCGKTSTKEILATLLGATGEVCASRASFNNHIGVPLTLLGVTSTARSLIVEIGTNHPGEIAPLAALARPDVAIVTNVGRSHLEGLGSIAGVAREKGALIAALSGEGTAVLNADCASTPELRARAADGVRLITFSAAGRADASLQAKELEVSASGTRFTLEGDAVPGPLRGRRVTVPLLGEHAVANVLAGLAATVAMREDLEAALGALPLLRPAPHRLEVSTALGVTVIDDAYNANPESVAAATRLLARVQPGERGGRRWLVLGEMGELGPGSPALHREAGELVAKEGIDRLLVVGPAEAGDPLAALLEGARSSGVAAEHARSMDDGARRLVGPADGLLEGDVVLFKASRATGLEALADQVRASLHARANPSLDRRGAEVML